MKRPSKPSGRPSRTPSDRPAGPRSKDARSYRSPKPLGTRKPFDKDDQTPRYPSKPRPRSGRSEEDSSRDGQRRSRQGTYGRPFGSDRKPSENRRPYQEHPPRTRASEDPESDSRRESQPKTSHPGKRPTAGPGKPHTRSSTGRSFPRPAQKQDTRKTSRKATDLQPRSGSYQEFPLNKYIAHCGVCSRRKAVDFIKDGQVKVNGSVVTEPGTKVKASDQVVLNGKPIRIQREHIYLLVNKPKGYITTTKDPRARKTVMELIEDACSERVYPVGRLDRNTSGLLLLTNDGDLAQKLSHPSNAIRKVYQVGLDKPLIKADFDKIVQGFELEDGPIHADVLAYSDAEDKRQIGIEIHSGRNHIVRRIFAALGYEVLTLDRVLYAGLTKKNLPRGTWRFLSEREVVFLKHF